jgi:ESS family glutamate:Na+ symporter
MEQLLSPYLVALFWVSILMPIGVILRYRLRILQKYLVPSSLITGLIGMVLMNLGLIGHPGPDGWVQIDHHTFAMLATLIFTANFILIGINAGKPTEGAGKSKEMTRGVTWLSISFVGGYGVLIMTGIPVIWAYNALSGAGLETATAVNLLQGFVGGPAQALTVSQIWVDNAARTDIHHLWTISPDVLVMAVSYGAAGFLVAAFVGVPLANYGLRKGLAAHTAGGILDESFLSGIMSKDSREPVGWHSLHPANMDTITFHIALLGIAFFFTWIFCYGLKMLLPTDISGIAFGLMFMWGMFCAIILRKFINATGNDHLIDEQLVNRLNGVCVDFMMVTALMAVEWAVLGKYIVPFVLSVALATFALFLWFWKTSRWLGKSGLERFLVNFAACTGTLASSILLMRIVDPKGKSLVLAEVGFSQFAMIFPVTPLALFIIPALGVKTTVSTVFYAGIFIFTVCFVLMVLLKMRGYWKGSEET